MGRPGPESDRILGVSDTTYMYVVFRVRDSKGNLVQNAPFWIDVYAPPGQNSSYQHGSNRTTDSQGLLTVDIPQSDFLNRQVSVTPLLPYPDGPANQAIIWQKSFMFTTDKSNVVDIVLKPGGGLDQKPGTALMPAPSTLPASPAPGGSGVSTVPASSTGTYVFLAVAGFVAGWLLIPIVFRYFKKGVPSG